LRLLRGQSLPQRIAPAGMVRVARLHSVSSMSSTSISSAHQHVEK
jgi:hypothetical protein